MNYTKGEWRAEKRHNFEPGVQSPNLKWRIIAKTHKDALPKAIAIIDSEANAHLIAAAPLMHGQLKTGVEALYEALNHLNGMEVSEAKDYIKGVIAGNQIALTKAEGNYRELNPRTSSGVCRGGSGPARYEPGWSLRRQRVYADIFTSLL